MANGRVLVAEEREEILRGISEGASDRLIGQRLGRDRSVVSREIARNGGRAVYSSGAAQSRARVSRLRPKTPKLEVNRVLHDYVAGGLAQNWSPQQISRRVAEQYAEDEAMRVSHETIYQALFLQARGELRTQLKLALRSGRTRRVAHGSTRPKQARIAGMVAISERPAEAVDRAVPGHWEGDLIVGKGGKSQIGTLVERTTRFTILVKVNYDRRAERMAIRLHQEISRLPAHLFRSLTWDQGVEMAAHTSFSIASGIPVYFCDPHSPWQRGTNENTNGLLRQYFPKGTDLAGYTQAELDAVADELNGRPRQTLNWKNPTEALTALLQTTT